jgi:hypothetical protein
VRRGTRGTSGTGSWRFTLGHDTARRADLRGQSTPPTPSELRRHEQLGRKMLLDSGKLFAVIVFPQTRRALIIARNLTENAYHAANDITPRLLAVPLCAASRARVRVAIDGSLCSGGFLLAHFFDVGAGSAGSIRNQRSMHIGCIAECGSRASHCFDRSLRTTGNSVGASSSRCASISGRCSVGLAARRSPGSVALLTALAARFSAASRRHRCAALV